MKDRNKSIKLGLIGCGRVGETRHLPVLASLPGVEVVAVADINADLLERVANRFHIERRNTDFRELLSKEAIEAVVVCVPAQFHIAVALAALDAGKHLFVEKPLALCLDECDQLIERAGRSPNKIIFGAGLLIGLSVPFSLWERALQTSANVFSDAGMERTRKLLATAGLPDEAPLLATCLQTQVARRTESLIGEVCPVP